MNIYGDIPLSIFSLFSATSQQSTVHISAHDSTMCGSWESTKGQRSEVNYEGLYIFIWASVSEIWVVVAGGKG